MRIIVGISGGVDSAATALLLKNKGHEVYGATCIMNSKIGTVDEQMLFDARKICEHLNIPHIAIDAGKDFDECVIRPFAESYYEGRTPNPCLLCNRYIKWGKMLELCKEMNADYFATGHYGTIKRLENGRYTVSKAKFGEKDQSYVLYNLTQEMLEKTLMPLGEYTKEEVRKMAAEAGISVADKPDSEDICFIPDKDYAAFVRKYTGRTDDFGYFTDKNGNRLGKHEGYINYTIGQRRGLKIALGSRTYVTGIDAESGNVILGSNEELFTNELTASNINYMGASEAKGLSCIGKIRYGHKGSKCLATVENGILTVKFEEPVRAATPGQAVVLYDFDGNLLLGAVIRESH